MTTLPRNTSSRAAAAWLPAGISLASVGTLVLLFEEHLDALLEFETGPFGANFVLLGLASAVLGFALRPPSRAVRLSAAGALLIVGAALLVLEAQFETVLGLDLGAAGTLLALLGGAIGAYHAGTLRSRTDGAGLGEKTALVSLIGTLLVTWYLLSRLEILGAEGAPDAGVLVKATGLMILIAIAEAVAIARLRSGETADTAEDERDVAIRRRAGKAAHTLLLALIGVLIVQIGFGARYAGLTTPVAIAHALLGVVILSELGRHTLELWLYRRDRM